MSDDRPTTEEKKPRDDAHSEEDDTEGYFTQEARDGAGDANNRSSGSNMHQSQGKSFVAGGDSNNESKVDRAGKLRRETLLPLKFVMDRLRHSVDSSELYGDLFVFFPFLILFIFFFLAGRDIEANFYVLQGVRDRLFWSEYPSVQEQLAIYRQQVLNNERLWVELDKDYPGIGNSGDWGDWMETVLIPNLFDCQHPDRSYTFNAPTGQNYLVGALRVRTQRARSDSCDVREILYPDNRTELNRVCFGPSKNTNEAKDGYRCRNDAINPLTNLPLYKYERCEDVPGAPTSAIEGFYHCGGYMFDIPFNATCNQALQFVAVLKNESCPYTDNWATRFVMAEYFMYTPALDTFHGIKLFSEVDVAGSWINQWLFRSFRVWSSTEVLQTVVDVCFFIFVLYYWFDFFYALYKHVKRDNKSALSYFAEFWTVLEMINMVTFMVVFGFRFSWMNVSNNADNLKLPMASIYPPKLDRLMVLFESQVYGNSINTMFVFLKLLKYVRLNPRLNVLTRTIAACQQSIFGVLVLFFTIIFGYAITGWNLFGVNVERFRNLGVAMSSLVRMLVGDIDYEELRNENRFLAGAFFWSYMVLALFLLLNFLIAIISESFAAVSGKAYSTPFEELLLRWWQGFKAYMNPKNLSRVCKNSCGGKGEAGLLRICVKEMEAYHEKQQEYLYEIRKQKREAQKAEFIKSGREEWANFLADNDNDDDDDDEELEVKIKFDDLPMVLGDTTVFDDLGEIYWQYTWENLMNEHDDARKSSEEVSKRRMAETVKLGVEKVLGSDIEKISELDEALKSVELEVGRMLALLDK